MLKTLKVDPDFAPCPVHDDDEQFTNGIFVFNISALLQFLGDNPRDAALVAIGVSDLPKGLLSLNESHVDTVDISRPVILAEISPGHHNLIDGNHRAEKARRLGISTIPAYKLSVRQLIPFLTSKTAYQAYLEYWNGKVMQHRQEKRRMRSLLRRHRSRT